MQRLTCIPRDGWQSTVEKLGFTYFNDSSDGVYWNESAYYKLTESEVESLYNATNNCFNMCIEAIDYIIENDLFYRFGISNELAKEIVNSWDRDDPTLYGRFDFSVDSRGNYKMLEFNADTPTSLFEGSIVQWEWMKSKFGNSVSQYNYVHDKLLEQFDYIKQRLPLEYGRIYFTSVTDSKEDMVTTFYLKSIAEEAGLTTKFIDISEIGFNGDNFVDMDEQNIHHIFKLYPWEWIVNEEFSQFAFSNMKTWIEPVWKMLLSNKAILPILWKLFPDHPNLLEAYFKDDNLHDTNQYWVEKPCLSREGANVTIQSPDGNFTSDGDYLDSPIIVQEPCILPKFGEVYACIGSWIVGDEPCGMGIREDSSPITKNTSKFVPHIYTA